MFRVCDSAALAVCFDSSRHSETGLKRCIPGKELSFESAINQLASLLVSRGWNLAVMESCTGGRLASEITSQPGCSDYFVGSAVSYATRTKVLLGVDARVIEAYGVVSAETARAMAEAIALRLEADCGLAITGVAGPQPQDGHPVGEVHVAVALSGKNASRSFELGPIGPDEIKARAIGAVLDLAIEELRSRYPKFGEPE
jgi:PncC family amidohydrolase